MPNRSGLKKVAWTSDQGYGSVFEVTRIYHAICMARENWIDVIDALWDASAQARRFAEQTNEQDFENDYITYTKLALYLSDIVYDRMGDVNRKS